MVLNSKKLGVFTVKRLADQTEKIDMKTQISKIMDIELHSPRLHDETSQELIQRVCFLYVTELEKKNGYSIAQFAASVIEEIEHEVVEVYRIKTYGFHSLAHYRKARLHGKVS